MADWRIRGSDWTLRKEKSLEPNETLLKSAFQRVKGAILTDGFVPYKLYARNACFEPHINPDRRLIERVHMQLYTCDTQREEPRVSSEAYNLRVTDSGQVFIDIVSNEGGLLALHTFSQLFYTHSKQEADVYLRIAPLNIKDSPVFKHRGLNLDVARNRIAPDDVNRTLRAMSMVRLNRLHLHASDAQSWPLDIPALPDLALKGAYDKDQIWSVADLKKVQAYGAERGIQVYLEIDMPGHTASIHHAYPHLVVAYDKQPWEEYAAEPPAGQLKLNSPDVPSFITKLLSDLLSRVTPYSKLFHVGGDEFNTMVYALEEGLETSDKEVLRPLLQKFFDHIFSITEAQSVTVVVWEELVLDWDLNIPNSAIIQMWRPDTDLASLMSKGHNVLFGSASHWYLDSGYGGWVEPDPATSEPRMKPPYLDWNGPYKNWRYMLSYDPLKNIPEHQRHLVMGGEAHLWGELTDAVNLDHMLWPRLAAAAEVLWRGNGEVCEESTRRLAELRERMVCRGIGAAMVQMEWCLRNPGSSFF